MHLVDGHRALHGFGIVPLGLMDFVVPLVIVQPPYDGSIVRALLIPKTVGIGFVALHAVRAGDDIAIGVSLANFRQKALPHAIVPLTAEHPLLVVPVGLGSNDGDVLGIGSPDTEMRALNAVLLIRVRSELAVDLVIGALVEKKAVVIGEGRVRHEFTILSSVLN